MNAATRAESLIAVTGRLIAALEREIALLREMRVAETAPLQAEKAALVAAYEDEVRALAASPGALEALAPAIRAELAALARRLDAAAAANGRAVQAAHTAHQRLLKAIVAAVEEKRTGAKGYGAAASTRRSPRRAVVSLTLDRRL